MEEKKRYTKVPVNKLPSIVEWVLKNATTDQLEFLNSMSQHHQFKSFLKLVEELKYYCMHEVFNYQAKEADDLAFFRAGKKGQFAAWLTMLEVIKEAGSEIDRRRKVKY